MPRRLEQWRSLAPCERRLLAQLLFLLPTIGATLRLLGFKRTRDLLKRFVPSSAASKPNDSIEIPFTAKRITRLVGIAGRHGPYRATCLRQSLALWYLLRRRRVPAQMCIGVRKENQELQAHAWVEYRGTPLGQENLHFAFFEGLDPGDTHYCAHQDQ